jgi:bleomycin hydrolase
MKKSLLCFIGLSAGLAFAQTTTNKAGSQYQFTKVYDVEATSIKDQNKSGTCWSFSTVSFLESELKRMGKGDFDLSEMTVVRNAYVQKAVKYVRLHGTINFGPGGAFHDPINNIRNFGMMPESAYPNTIGASAKVDHNEMDKVLKSYVETIAKSEGEITPQWIIGFNGILDAYLGKQPENFTYNGKSYTSKTFSDYLGLKPDDYVDLTSYTHHPFYQKFALEIPDNWSWDETYNLPLDEWMNVLEYALSKGFTVAWGADVSDKGFSHKNGLALIPESDWENMTKNDKDSVWIRPCKQRAITQEMRQKDYDNYQTTDDHGMQITGMYKDQKGTKWFKVKNSWGTGHGNECGGYFYASENYVRLRTMNFMVHKDGIPQDMKNKLGLK